MDLICHLYYVSQIYYGPTFLSCNIFALAFYSFIKRATETNSESSKQFLVIQIGGERLIPTWAPNGRVNIILFVVCISWKAEKVHNTNMRIKHKLMQFRIHGILTYLRLTPAFKIFSGEKKYTFRLWGIGHESPANSFSSWNRRFPPEPGRSVIYPLEIEATLIMRHSLCGTHYVELTIYASIQGRPKPIFNMPWKGIPRLYNIQCTVECPLD